MVSEAKTKTKAKNKTEGTGFSDHRQSNLKILTLKQMYEMNSYRLFIHYIGQKKLLKKYTTT